jgi:hypothetical protein
VWDSNNKANDNLDNADKSSSVTTKTPVKKESANTDETANWKEVNFKSANISVKIPDGWNINNIYESQPTFETYYSLGHEGIQYKANTAATVTAKTGEPSLEKRDAAFQIYFSQQLDNATEKQPSPGKTKSGKTIDKYLYISTTDPEGLGDYKKGTKVFSYYVNVGDKLLVVRHVIEPGESDQTLYMDKLVQTIK